MSLSPLDRAGLSDLVNRYATLVDHGEFAAVAELFTTDGVLVAPSPPECLDPVRTLAGTADIASELSQLGDFDVTVHYVNGFVFDAGDRPGRARGRVRCVAHHVTRHEGGTVDVVWHLRYHDEYEIHGARWRFLRREISIDILEAQRVREARGRLGLRRAD